MTKEELEKEIVKLVCEQGKGLSLMEAYRALHGAQEAFMETAKVVDGMLAPKSE